MVKQSKNLIYWFFIPYAITCLVFFYENFQSNTNFHSVIEVMPKAFQLTNIQAIVLLAIPIILLNFMILLFEYHLCKIFLKPSDKHKNIDVSIITSLMVAYINSSLIALWIQDLFGVSFSRLAYFIPLIELAIFLITFFCFTRDIKATRYVLLPKVIFLFANYVFLIA